MTNTTESLPAIEAVRRAFADNFSRRGEVGASLSIWRHGRPLAQLAGGFEDREQTRPWSAASIVLWWSGTKGPTAACVLRALQDRGLPVSLPVAEVWPEFAGGGKSRLTVADVISHRAGLCATEGTGIDPFDHDAVASALARQRPIPVPDARHAYHPRTFGYLAEELVRRLAGVESLGRYWRESFADPLGLEFWIGLPGARLAGVAATLPPRTHVPPAAEAEFYERIQERGSLPNRAFRSPCGFVRPSVMNEPRARQHGFPALGGIGTADALAKFYAMLASGGELDGRRYLDASLVDQLSTPLTSGRDEVLCLETAFSLGFMLDPVCPSGRKRRMLFGPSPRAFGHPGAGGSLAFADPDNNIAFAYVMNQMGLGILPNERALSLVRALYSLDASP